jgi:thioredoxin reductase
VPDGEEDLLDVVVVGGGPAGLTAALFLGRCLRRVLVVDDGQPRNAAAQELHGFLTRDGIPPLELLGLGREELATYGVGVRNGRVLRATAEQGGLPRFHVTVESGEVFRCRRLLLATGLSDALPEVDGASRFYGRGVHHCPYCDGWEVRGRRLIAYGPPPGSAGLALHLLRWSAEVTLCTDGHALEREHADKLARNGVRVVQDRVARLDGDPGEGRLGAVELASGERLPADALFFSAARFQHSDLAGELGCEVTEDGSVSVKGAQRTGVRGVFLAGDAAGDVQFAVVAAGEGARAAVAINEDLEEEDLS